jgi:hypothetical protein
MISEKFVLLSVVLNIVGSAHYAIGTLKGVTKPNRVTWFLWTLAPMIAFTAMLQDGVGMPALMTLAIGVGPLMVLIASFVNRNAYWQVTRLDIACGALSILALVLWLITGEGFVAVFLSILADLVAGVPTVIKAYKEPHTERYLVFLLGSIGAIITLLAIDKWEFSYYAFPIYFFLLCAVLFVLVRFPAARFKKQPRPEVL